MASSAFPCAVMSEIDALRDKAARCRRLARQSTDARAIAALKALAAECDAEAGASYGPR